MYANNTKEELLELYGDHPLFCLAEDAYLPLKQAQALFIVNWSLPIKPDVNRLNEVGLPIFDAKNILTEQQINQLVGFYTGIGCKK